QLLSGQQRGVVGERLRHLRVHQPLLRPVDARLDTPRPVQDALARGVPVAHALLDSHALHGPPTAVDGDTHVIVGQDAVPRQISPHPMTSAGPTSVTVKERSWSRYVESA